jgi:ferrous iron transport protein A
MSEKSHQSTLDRLPPHVPARVSGLVRGSETEHDAEVASVLLRLIEIGFLPGEPVQIMARGFPVADPLAVRVGHSTFALRAHEAALVEVTW